MIRLILFQCLCLLSISLYGQKKIKDKHITNQQERMVFKSWDRGKFTPTSGFLGLNPEYWITWALHPNYPKSDLRPLGPNGPQSQRLGLVAAMQSVDNSYKLHADTIRNLAVMEANNYSSALSNVDPLWILYYRREFENLINQQDIDPLYGLSQKEKEYFIQSGLLDWYIQETKALLERLEISRTTTLDRGARILAYHRMLSEYRTLSSTWETKKKRAKLYLSIKESKQKINSNETQISKGKKSDKEIANEILKKSKL